MPEKSLSYFAFSIRYRGLGASGGLADLIGRMNEAGIKVAGFAAFVAGRQTKVFCVPENADTFRAFAKKRKLRVTEKTAVHISYEPGLAMNVLHRWALAERIPALSFSKQARAFAYLPVKRH